MPVETAVNKPKERKERVQKAPPAAVGRQTSAVDVLRSMQVDEEEGDAPADDASPAKDEAEQPQANSDQPAPPP